MSRRLELNKQTQVDKVDPPPPQQQQQDDLDLSALPCRSGHCDELTIQDTVLLFQLHRVLNAADMSPLLRKLKDEVPRGHSDLSVHAVCHLLAMDLSFGMFGTPIAREDDRLNIVALTSFDVYDKQVLESPVDVITILTPLFRTLYIVQLCLAKVHSYDAFKSADPLAFLPYKPASVGNHRARYASFLDVVLSAWTGVCHAYMTQQRGGGEGARLEPRACVQELHCFNVKEDRAKHVWLDIDVAALTSTVIKGFAKTADDVMTGVARSWISVKTTTYDIGFKLMIILEPDEEEDEEKEGPDLCTRLVCLFTVDTVDGIYRRCGKPLTFPKSDASIIDKLIQEYGPIVTVVFRITNQAPGFALSAVHGDHSQFLLLTLDGGQYSAFYRNLGNQDIIAYPLYMHPLPPRTCRFKVPCTRCGRPYVHTFDYDYMTLVNFDEQPKYCSGKCLDGNLYNPTTPSAKRNPGTPPTLNLTGVVTRK
jgi:hypothetical protein